jgi:hypothetical protein
MKALEGKKSYLVGIGALLAAAGLYLQGNIELGAAVQLAVTALLGIFVRRGIKTDTGND